MEALFGMADAVVLPTRGEGFNLPAAEAMAGGIPVVTTGYSAHLDVCHKDNAYLVAFDFERTGSHVGASEAMWASARVSNLSVTMGKLVFAKDGEAARNVEGKVRSAQQNAAGMTWAATAGGVEDFALSLQENRSEKHRLRLAWVSTWNTRCGIATYSEFLLDALAKDAFEVGIFADQQKFDKPDGSNVVRCWTDRNGTTEELVERVIADRYDVVVIQFNFSFHSLQELGTAVRKLEAAGVSCHVFLHATSAPLTDGRHHSLREIRDDLALATRLIVHSVEDVNRLKQFGLVDNVLKLPHGAHQSVPLKLAAVVRQLLSIDKRQPIIACYGFLLPGKGLPEVIAAVALLRTTYPDVLLLLLNSSYPHPNSETERALCLDLIADLDLGRSVMMINDFLDNDVTMVLLQAADIVVFAYQNTSESASGAVRYGLSSLRPVVTTPLPIFQDIQSLVHHTAGLSPTAIAEGITMVIEDAELRAVLLARQKAWLDEHCWERIGEQFSHTIIRLYEDRVSVTAPGGETGPSSTADHPLASDRSPGSEAVLVPEAVEGLAFGCQDGHVDAAVLAALGSEPFGAERTRADHDADDAGRAAPDGGRSKVELILFKDLNRGSDAQFVRRMYSWILHRKPDTSGFTHHIDHLATGHARADLVRGMLLSEELRQSGRDVQVVFGLDV